MVLRATWLRARTITNFWQLIFVRLQEAGAHHAEMNTMRDELRQLRIENSRLRRENEKGLAAGGVKAPSGSRQGPASPAPRDLAENAPAATPRDDDELNSAVIRTIALKQLKEVIEQIYASKDKYDAKCAESHLPRETLEQHMYTFLNQVCSRMPWPLRPLLRTRIHRTCLGSDKMTRILCDTSPDLGCVSPPSPPPKRNAPAIAISRTDARAGGTMQRYGLRQLIIENASAIIKSVTRYGDQDNDVLVFRKILKNEIDEDFRKVQKQVKHTVGDLLRVHLKGKQPLKTDDTITAQLKEKLAGDVVEAEWSDIVRYMYNPEDSATLAVTIKDFIRRRAGRMAMDAASARVQMRSTSRGNDVDTSSAEGRIRYDDFVKILLDFQVSTGSVGVRPLGRVSVCGLTFSFICRSALLFLIS
jgi:hypothetical protein